MYNLSANILHQKYLYTHYLSAAEIVIKKYYVIPGVPHTEYYIMKFNTEVSSETEHENAKYY